MQVLPQLTQIPIWLLIIVLLLIFFSIIIALRTGRELHFWPPSIGPAMEKANLEEEIKRLQARLNEENIRYSTLQNEVNQARQRLQVEIDLLRQRLKEVELDRLKLQEKLAATWRPLGSEQHIGELLASFDRQAMKIPAHEEHFGAMFHSLRELRIELQQAGVSTLVNPVIRELFEKIKQDIEWMENTIVVLIQKDIVASRFFDAHKSPHTTLLQYRDDLTDLSNKQVDETHQLISTMVERVCRTGVGHEKSKELMQDELVDAMTAIWFFASMDRVRMNILSEVAILRRLLEQDI